MRGCPPNGRPCGRSPADLWRGRPPPPCTTRQRHIWLSHGTRLLSNRWTCWGWGTRATGSLRVAIQAETLPSPQPRSSTSPVMAVWRRSPVPVVSPPSSLARLRCTKSNAHSYQTANHSTLYTRNIYTYIYKKIYMYNTHRACCDEGVGMYALRFVVLGVLLSSPLVRHVRYVRLCWRSVSCVE